MVGDGCSKAMGAGAGVVVVLWFNQLDNRYLLGGIIAGAMIINMVVAGVSGVVLPLILDRVGIDPAVASGVFVTTVTDVIGFFAFLGLATVILL